MKPLFLVPILLFFSSCAKTQTIFEGNSELKFSQAWVWEYENELIPQGEPGHQGEMVVYFNPELNYWLFNYETNWIGGEMFEWILSDADGRFLAYGKDEFGKSRYLEEKLDFESSKEIPDYYSAAEKVKTFNQNELGYEEITGQAFEFQYEKMEESSIIYLAESAYNFLPIYYFNHSNFEAKLPFNFSTDLPKNILVLEQETKTTNGHIRIRLKMISSTEHYIYLDKNLMNN